MNSRTEDDHRGPNDPAGVAWTLMLASALVIVIGLIAYLVLRGDAVPGPHPPAVANLPQPKLPTAPIPDPPPLPTPVPAR